MLATSEKGKYILCLLTPDSKLELNKLYFSINNQQLQYTFITSSKKVVTDTIEMAEYQLKLHTPLTETQLKQNSSILLNILAERRQIHLFPPSLPCIFYP